MHIDVVCCISLLLLGSLFVSDWFLISNEPWVVCAVRRDCEKLKHILSLNSKALVACESLTDDGLCAHEAMLLAVLLTLVWSGHPMIKSTSPDLFLALLE